MPTVRFGDEGQGQAEGESGGRIDAQAAELNRVVSNITLSEHIGRFMAGEIQARFQDENLAEVLKGRNQIMISGSWG